jgi:HK97 gp10 family phage protein
VHRGIRHAWFETGKDLEKEANREILKGKKTGKHWPGLRNRSSAPGETHANQSGKLRKSIGWKVHGSDSITFGYGVSGSAPKYAKFMEFGTPKGQMAARPTLQNAVRATERDTQVNLEIEIKKAIP